MNIEETTGKIKRNLKLVKGIQDIKINIEDFLDKNSKPTYIEFKLSDNKYETNSFAIYSKLSKRIRENNPQISIGYSNPKIFHNNSTLRRIIINIRGDIKAKEKQELLEQAAIDFHGILKRWVKYGPKK